MAVLKKVLGYEICLWKIEGNVLRGIPLVLLRKNGFTEIVSFEDGKVIHEMGDKINRDTVRDGVYQWILENNNLLLEEYELASRYSSDEYIPKPCSHSAKDCSSHGRMSARKRITCSPGHRVSVWNNT